MDFLVVSQELVIPAILLRRIQEYEPVVGAPSSHGN